MRMRERETMARSLREALVDELLKLGLSMELIALIFPVRGTALNDVIGELGRVLRWLAGHRTGSGWPSSSVQGC